VGGNFTSIFGGATDDVVHGVDGAYVTGVTRSVGSAGHRKIVRIRKRRFYSTTCPFSALPHRRHSPRGAIHAKRDHTAARWRLVAPEGRT